MNPYLLIILLFFGIYCIYNFIIKLRANKLLKIIYRMIFFEKRQVGFIFMQSKINSAEKYRMVWAKNIDREKIFSDVDKSLIKFKDLDKFSFYFDDINEFAFTYNEYLILCEKFIELVVERKSMIKKSTDEFKIYMDLLKKRHGFQYENLLKEYEIFDEYYCFPPTQSELIRLLEYLKKNLYVTDVYTIQLTKKAFDSLNLAENLNSSIEFEKIIGKLFSE
jgi:hypothetical protein